MRPDIHNGSIISCWSIRRCGSSEFSPISASTPSWPNGRTSRGTPTLSAALHAEPASPEELEEFHRLAAPLLYGRWNAAARRQAAAEPAQFAPAASEGFYAGFEQDPTLPKRLAALTVPVLLVVGEYDIWPTCTAVRELAHLLRDAELAVLPRAGHFPWVDDPDTFATTVHGFLAQP